MHYRPNELILKICTLDAAAWRLQPIFNRFPLDPTVEKSPKVGYQLPLHNSRRSACSHGSRMVATAAPISSRATSCAWSWRPCCYSRTRTASAPSCCRRGQLDGRLLVRSATRHDRGGQGRPGLRGERAGGDATGTQVRHCGHAMKKLCHAVKID